MTVPSRLLFALALAGSSSDASSWQFRDFSATESGLTAEAVLESREGFALLAINCSHAADPTLSIQYRPSDEVGIAMARVVMDWLPSRGVSLDSQVVWEPSQQGAYARDGVSDRHASEIAEELITGSGTVAIVAADQGGTPIKSTFDIPKDSEAVVRVMKLCPWYPNQVAGEGN